MRGESRPGDRVGADARASRDALRLASIYAGLSALWILLSDRLVDALPVANEVRDVIDSVKGVGFVIVSAVVGFVLIRVSLWRLYRSQDQLRRTDGAIRQAYIDVLDAVTGGRLMLMPPEELQASVGEVLLPMTPLHGPDDVREARTRLGEVLEPLVTDLDEAVLAASEGLTNALKHGSDSRYGAFVRGGCVQIVIEDAGPGLDFRTLPRATLMPGFSTKPSLGMGFTIMLDLSDRLLLATQPGDTTVVLEFDVERSPILS